MGGKASREKGKRGERQVAAFLKNYGFDAQRGQQYCGINGDADVIGLPYVHIEVKQVETLRLQDAMEQSRQDAREDEIPTVWFKKSNCQRVVILSDEDFMRLYLPYYAERHMDEERD